MSHVLGNKLFLKTRRYVAKSQWELQATYVFRNMEQDDFDIIHLLDKLLSDATYRNISLVFHFLVNHISFYLVEFTNLGLRSFLIPTNLLLKMFTCQMSLNTFCVKLIFLYDTVQMIRFPVVVLQYKLYLIRHRMQAKKIDII